MAWFNKNESSAPQTAPLTAQRVSQWFESKGLDHQLIEEQETVITGFDGVFVKVSCDHQRLSFQAALLEPAPAERYAAALSWSNHWNCVAVAPTAIPTLNPDKGVEIEMGSALVLGDAGCSDEQLDLFLSTYSTLSVQALDEYKQAMGIEDAAQ
ncbi:hypothetical protein CCICO_08650 [Corynebacterium ciconiae DSM 44920]|uniref:YbjN domain-containing protein n=1 Tax=Corynebacterium ciconiae TaxID=227319 RepID=UPI00037EFC91|nr:YbjN domain-containing protein [Corynebacterium ciconiae]WKD61739.1 hypothetical protein CCICO_08650 [Corynebacterium ciconiae DSM 44920]